MRREARAETVNFTHQLSKDSIKFEVVYGVTRQLRRSKKNLGEDLQFDYPTLDEGVPHLSSKMPLTASRE